MIDKTHDWKASPLDRTTHPAWIEIDLDAMTSNFREVQKRVGPKVKVIASVKGNAYGIGAAASARVFAFLGAYAVATGSFEDAMAIRRAAIDVRIHMFPGMLPEAAGEYLRYDLIPSVYNAETAEAIASVARQPVSVFVKVDAGLGRLGVPLESAEAFIKHIVSTFPNIRIEGIFTHLPFNDATGRDWAAERITRFHELLHLLEAAGIHIPVTQAVASAGVASHLKTDCNTVCVGHLLYGGLARVTPDLGDLSAFRPVLRALKARLIHVQSHPYDTHIGLGGQQFLPANSITGVIPVGLYHGYRPAISERTAMVLVRGRRVPVLSVTQEYTTLDLTPAGDLKLGEEVVLLGGSGGDVISIEEFATWQGSSPLGVLMSLNERFPYEYQGGPIDDGRETVPPK